MRAGSPPPERRELRRLRLFRLTRMLRLGGLVAALALTSGCPPPHPSDTPRSRPRPAKRVTRLTAPLVKGLFHHFRPERRVFSWRNAYLAAIASQAAYEHQDRRTRKLLQAMGFPRITFLSQGTTQGYVASSPHLVLVAFRGTEITRWADIKTDGAVCQRPALGGHVHRGFYTGLDLVWPTLERTIRAQARLPTGGWKPIWITGHSLGGALATLAALRLDRAKIPVRGTITVGQPRVVGRDLAARFPGRERVYRLTNRGDPVVLVPVRYQWKLLRGLRKACSFDYQHVGVAREFRKGRGDVWTVAKVNPAPDTAPATPETAGAESPARGLPAFFRRLSSVFTVARHMLPRYLQNIWSQLPPAARQGLPPPSRL